MISWSCDLHTHTRWSDGNMDVYEMAEYAIQKGMRIFGISEHSPMPIEDNWNMKRADAAARMAQMREGKEKLGDRLTLLCGLELDYTTKDFPLTGYDYIIGSVHKITEGGTDTIDECEETSDRLIRECFGGDPYAYTSAYYECLSGFAGRKEAQIIGHFDIIAKFNEHARRFDESAPAYLTAAKEAAQTLCKADKIFEINTGAMSRGYKSVPYPSRTLLRFIRECGGRITFGSDAHDGQNIGYRFAEAVELALSCGFTAAMELSRDGFVEKPLI